MIGKDGHSKASDYESLAATRKRNLSANF